MGKAIQLAKKEEHILGHEVLQSVLVVVDNKLIHQDTQILSLLSQTFDHGTFYFPYEPNPVDQLIRYFHKANSAHIILGSKNLEFPGVFAQQLLIKGITVEWLETEESLELNAPYRYVLHHSLPYVTLSWGMSLDGKIATNTGDSKYISNALSRRFIHRLRTHHDAILVGINTIINDDPLLTTRLVKGRNPTRIILDTHLRFPATAKMLDLHEESSKTIIATCEPVNQFKKNQLEARGATILIVNKVDEQLDLHHLLHTLHQLGVFSILVEGGSTVHFAFLKDELVQRVFATISPIIIGGITAKTAVGGEGFSTLATEFHLSSFKFNRLGEDLIIESHPQKAY